MPVMTPTSGSSWVTLPEAEAYFAGRLNATSWHSSSQKLEALITAENDIINCGRYTFVDDDGEDVTTSDAMKYAACEQALFLLTDPDMETRRNLMAQGVGQAGVVGETWNSRGRRILIAPRAAGFLAEYLHRPSSFEIVR